MAVISGKNKVTPDKTGKERLSGYISHKVRMGSERGDKIAAFTDDMEWNKWSRARHRLTEGPVHTLSWGGILDDL